jgi:hypothetical protein
MSKRPSLIADLDLAAEPATAPAPQPAQPAPAKVVKISQPKAAEAPEADLVRSSIYLSRASHDRLREIAFVEKKKVHDLIVEGIDQVIAKRGHKETARRSKPKA